MPIHKAEGSADTLQNAYEKILVLVAFNKIMATLLSEFEDGTALSIYNTRTLRDSLPFNLYFLKREFDFSSIPLVLLRDSFSYLYPSATPWLNDRALTELVALLSPQEVLETLCFIAKHEHPVGYRTHSYLAVEVFEELVSLKKEHPYTPIEWVETIALGHLREENAI